MSAVSLQRPLLHHLHLHSLHFCRRPYICCLRGGGRSISSALTARAAASVALFQTRSSSFWSSSSSIRSATSGLAAPGGRSEKHFEGPPLHLTWRCRGEAGYQKVGRRGLKRSPLIAMEEEKKVMVVEERAVLVEEKPTGKRRPSVGPKQLNLRTAWVHGSTFISYVQILGTGMDTRDTSPSLDHVFLTRVCSETASGMPGLLLTLSNTGETGMTVNLWGPSDLNFLVEAMRTFIPSSSVVHAHSFGNERRESPRELSSSGDSSPRREGDTIMLLEDEVVKISAVLLHPEPRTLFPGSPGRKQEAQAFEKDGMDESRSPRRLSLQGSGRLSGAKSEGSSFSFAEPWELGFESETTPDRPGSPKRARRASPVVIKPPVVDEQRSPGKDMPSPGKEIGNSSGGTQGSQEVAVIYICELPEIIGKFDPAKAMAFGLLPGPKYGQLQAGKSVRAIDGKTVHPSDVMDPSSPGPVCLVVDCPTTSHVSSLMTALGLKQFFPKDSDGSERANPKRVTCIVHLAPAAVMNFSQYQEWMAQFEGTQHIVAGHGMQGKVPPVLKASARIMSRLNFICPQVFPIVGLQQADNMMETLQNSQTIVPAENLLKFRLRPISSTPIDRSLVPTPLDLAAVQQELRTENPELQEASEVIARLWNPSFSPVARSIGSLDLNPPKPPSKDNASVALNDHLKYEDQTVSEAAEGSHVPEDDPGFPDCLKGVGREEMEMVFLGTGSSQPSKYRNVSAIYIHLFKRGGLLLDCGEGTYAQLKRRYGNKNADEIVAGLKCVWISHIHADHHTGLARILSARKKLLESKGRFEPCLVVGPKQLKRYLDAYGRLEDVGMEFLDCSQTTVFAESAAILIANGQDYEPGSSPGSPRGRGPLENSVTPVGAPDKSTGKSLLEVKGGLIRLPSPKRSSKNVDRARPVSGLLRNYMLQSGFNFQAGLDEQGREKLTATLSALGLSSLISVPVVHCPHAFGVVLVARGKKLLQPGWKLVYSGDTRPCQALVEASKGATVLIHEATFDDAMLEEAVAKNHSLTREAVETGISAGVYRTILTHFSQRYPKIPVFNESYTDRTCIAFDMMSANLVDLPLLPKLLPALKLLFKNDLFIVEEAGDKTLTEQS